jgi:hypothetical protein
MAGDFKNITAVIQHFDPVSLGEMDAVKLMNRTDTKFVFHTSKLQDLLSLSTKHYRVLEIGKIRTFQYNSLYYDTEGLDFHVSHHNGARPRFKVRFREYMETGKVYLEIKKKTNKERTQKCRIEVEKIEMELTEKSLRYIEELTPIPAAYLKPALWTIFRRITLVGRDCPERITIDYDLTFRHGEISKQLPFLSICEVKRDSFAGKSEFMRTLKELSVHPGKSSKYCLGTVLLKDQVKQNRFKSYLLKINQLENDLRFYPAAGKAE